MTFLPGGYGILESDTVGEEGSAEYDVPYGSSMGDNGQTVPNVKEEDRYRFTGWKLDGDETGKLYTSEEILALHITENMTFIAQYERRSVPTAPTTPQEPDGLNTEDHVALYHRLS